MKHRLVHLEHYAQIIMLLIWVPLTGLTLYSAWYNRNAVLPYLANANYSSFLLALLFYLAALPVVTLGWSLIMRSFAGPIGWSTHAVIYCVTQGARRLPGTVWYVGGRLVLYKRLGVSRVQVAIASGVELAVSVVSGFLVGLALLPLGLRLPAPMIPVLIAGLVIGILALHPSVLAHLMHWIGRPMAKSASFKDTLAWLGAYAGMWLLSGGMVVQIVSVFQSLTVEETVYVIAAWAFSGAVGLLTVFLPTSLGATELAMAVLLSRIVPLPVAVAVSILIRILTTTFEVILAVALYPFVSHSKDLQTQDVVE